MHFPTTRLQHLKYQRLLSHDYKPATLKESTAGTNVS